MSTERTPSQRLWDAFKFDVRDDKTLYDGMDIDTLRKRHSDEVLSQHDVVVVDIDGGTDPRESPPPVQEWVFLLADTDVLTMGTNEGWIKAVDAHYLPENYVGTWRHPKTYWGWMKMDIGASGTLWGRMEIIGEMYDFAPRIHEGEYAVEIWDGQLCDVAALAILYLDS
jgi:hypothetical protein